MQEHGHSLALAFDTAGADFVRGVEVWRLWERMRSDEPIDAQVHASNAEIGCQGYRLTSSDGAVYHFGDAKAYRPGFGKHVIGEVAAMTDV